MNRVRTRFAPSPTGTPESIHLGFVIRALWNYAYAKKNDGQFVLRIEDTDQKRSRKDTEAEIYNILQKFNIKWNEGPDVGGDFGPYRQSERLDLYKEAAKLLVEKGYAYYDFDAVQREKEEIKASYSDDEKVKELKVRPKARENTLEESLKRIENGDPYVVRVKIPENRTFEYTDWILKKKIKFFGKEVSDMILLKSDGFPTYHLAVVVDDIAMQISHVFRGQEWISSTPIHLFVYEGLGKPVPEIGHFSVILDPRTGKKFSKRDMTAFFGVNTWLNDGYLPEALLNYLMLLGWAPKDNKELFTLEEFVEAFDQDGVQKSNPTFDVNKLNWFNGQYIRKLSVEELLEKLNLDNNEKNKAIVSLIHDRLEKLSDFESLTKFFFEQPDVDVVLFGENYKDHLIKAIEGIEKERDLMEVVKENNFKTGDFFMSLRIAITGMKFTPPINESIAILGKEETLARLKKLI
ncbi:MAG: glutamate--tRNA ligase [Microgenomates group bacterium]